MKTRPYFTSSYYIKGFFGEHRWLSNFHIAPLKVLDVRDGERKELEFQSTENFYQWRKLVLAGAETDILKSCQSGPALSKKLGKSVDLGDKLPIWESIKVKVMEQALRWKFEQHADLYSKLLATSGLHLEESNNWGDKFWGVSYIQSSLGERSNMGDTWQNMGGRNLLGHLLMKLREEWIVAKQGL